MRPWLTTRDVAAALQLRDLRTTRRVMRGLGAVQVGGQLRLPAHALESLAGPNGIIAGATKDPSPSELFPRAVRASRDPLRQVPATLERGWLDEE